MKNERSSGIGVLLVVIAAASLAGCSSQNPLAPTALEASGSPAAVIHDGGSADPAPAAEPTTAAPVASEDPVDAAAAPVAEDAVPEPVAGDAPEPTPTIPESLPAPTPAPSAASDGPCGSLPCAPIEFTTCPAGTVQVLGDVITCEPPPVPVTCPPGTQPVLGETVSCQA